MSQSAILAYADPLRREPEPSHPAPAEHRSAVLAQVAPEPLLEAPTLTPTALTAWTMPRLWIL